MPPAPSSSRPAVRGPLRAAPAAAGPEGRALPASPSAPAAASRPVGLGLIVGIAAAAGVGTAARAVWLRGAARRFAEIRGSRFADGRAAAAPGPGDTSRPWAGAQAPSGATPGPGA